MLPSAFIIAARGWRPVAAAAGAAAVFLLPVASALPALVERVVFYHAGRGIEIGSAWSNLLLVAGQFGYDVVVVYRYGAFEVSSAAVPTLKLLSTALFDRRRHGKLRNRLLAAPATVTPLAWQCCGLRLSPRCSSLEAYFRRSS